MKVKVDADKYSDSSKQSYGFELRKRDEYYADIHYNCIKCGTAAIYPALEQKKAYENRQEHICSKRVLCPTCWRTKRALKEALATIEDHYIANKDITLLDRVFLEQWLQKLNHYSGYTRKPNSMRIQFLQKHLKKLVLQFVA